MATYVLVHGAFVGGWCWRWVTPHLRGAGHDVSTPTLTGLGERAHLASPQVTLDTHIDDIVNHIRFDDLHGVVLVGWSYGGMVVAGVADRIPERIAQVVYLDSDIPRDGDTSVPRAEHAARVALADRHGDGWRVPVEATRARDLLLAGLAPQRRRWVEERLRPHPLATWLQPIHLTGAGNGIPTTYIRCTIGHDPSLEDTRRQDDRIRSEPAWRYVELAETHAAPLSAPDTVARTLLDALGHTP